MKSFKIEAQACDKVRNYFPWVFANEIQGSLKNLEVGELVALLDHKSQFVAYAYGNPHSLICMRILSCNENEKIDDTFVLKKLIKASHWRKKMGLNKKSHRLCFGEVDGLPGLIVDLYLLENQKWDLVFQIGTQGMEKLLSTPTRTFQELATALKLDLNSVIERRDSRGRKLENLEINEEALIHFGNKNEVSSGVLLRSSNRALNCSRELGQKTGLFLDQQDNLIRFKEILKSYSQTENLKMLDLFCYVGQWTQAAQDILTHESVEFHLSDSSKEALKLAQDNASLSKKTFIHQKDLLKDIGDFPPNEFDIIICDPPALIQSKKDINAGKRAYLKLNTASIKALKTGGLLVSCSCSQHLSEDDLLEILTEAARKTSRNLRIISPGQQSQDHPRLIHFPQSYYLKAFFVEVI
jgi:23S rRNA (cytosine1962-C5)-methyltransferase